MSGDEGGLLMSGPIESVAVRSLWEQARDLLHHAKERVFEEIRSYPTPIAGCDLQFNHLLEKQAGIARELEYLDEAFHESLHDPDPGTRLEEFIAVSNYLDDEAKRLISANLLPALTE
jgi:hypothetical protein